MWKFLMFQIIVNRGHDHREQRRAMLAHADCPQAVGHFTGNTESHIQKRATGLGDEGHSTVPPFH
jgi:hypothetical protein